MTFVSYAQNFEDVMLWRALKRFTPGRYIDIGAQDPVVDSVSKAFHDAGWRGIHVEPLPYYADLLRHAFPKDRVIEAAVAARTGSISFYEVPGGGLSTARADIARFHREHGGHELVERTVSAVTLAQILDEFGDEAIHWLKIDVEGLEQDVLKGWGDSRQRPWIVVVESTFPTTDEPIHRDWEDLISAKGYDLAYTDGLNRFYLSRDQAALQDSFRYPPNVFDDFELSGTATSLTTGLARRHAAELAKRSSRIDALETTVERMSAERTALAVAAVDQRAQRRLDETSIATELQRLRAAERNGDLAVRANRRLEAEKAAADTKATELDAKLAAAVRSLAETRVDRDRLHRRATDAATANLELVGALESSQYEAKQLAGQLHLQRQLVAEGHKRNEAQFQVIVDANYTLRTTEELLGLAREEVARLSRELDGQFEHLTQLREVLKGALRENDRLSTTLSRTAATFWIRWFVRLRLIRIATHSTPRSALAWQLLAETPPSSSSHELEARFKDSRPMAEIVPIHVDQILTTNGDQFVDQIYRTFLRRSPDRAGFDHYIGRLRAGDGKEAVLLAVADSAEARALPCQLEGMDEFRQRNRNSARRNNDIRRLERSINRIDFGFGEMYLKSEARIDQIAHQLGSVEGLLVALRGTPASQSSGRPAAMPVGRPVRDMLHEVTASEPSRFIGELREAVRQSSEAATFANPIDWSSGA